MTYHIYLNDMYIYISLFPRVSERRVLLQVGVCHTFIHTTYIHLHILTSSIFTFSHLHTFTSLSSHLLFYYILNDIITFYIIFYIIVYVIFYI